LNCNNNFEIMHDERSWFEPYVNQTSPEGPEKLLTKYFSF
jgi:hypothetical protein